MGMSGDEAGAYAQTLHILDLQPDYYPALRGLALGAAAAERRDEYGRRLQKAVNVGSRDARVYFDRIQFSRRTGKDIDKIGTVFDKGLVALPGKHFPARRCCQILDIPGRQRQDSGGCKRLERLVCRIVRRWPCL